MLEIQRKNKIINTFNVLSEEEFEDKFDKYRWCSKNGKLSVVDGTIVTTTSSVPIIKILGNTNTVPSKWPDNPTYTVWTFEITDTEDGTKAQNNIVVNTV